MIILNRKINFNPNFNQPFVVGGIDRGHNSRLVEILTIENNSWSMLNNYPEKYVFIFIFYGYKYISAWLHRTLKAFRWGTKLFLLMALRLFNILKSALENKLVSMDLNFVYPF